MKHSRQSLGFLCSLSINYQGSVNTEKIIIIIMIIIIMIIMLMKIINNHINNRHFHKIMRKCCTSQRLRNYNRCILVSECTLPESQSFKRLNASHLSDSIIFRLLFCFENGCLYALFSYETLIR